MVAPVLVLLNGLPGSGKSTLARAWCERHASALPLALDLDLLRSMLGGWRDAGDAAGLAARAMACAAIRAHLDTGRDVVVPQFLRRPAFLDQLQEVAQRTGAAFVHAVLEVEPEVAAARLGGRARGAEGELEQPFAVLAEELHRFLTDRRVVRVEDVDALDRAVTEARQAM